MPLVEYHVPMSTVWKGYALVLKYSVRCTPWRPGASSVKSQGEVAGGFGKPVVAQANNGNVIELDEEICHMLLTLQQGAHARCGMAIVCPCSDLPLIKVVFVD